MVRSGFGTWHGGTILHCLRVIVLLSFIAAGPALGQSVYHQASLEGQPRDVVVDARGSAAYVALYDRNEVVRVDLTTRETTMRARVGRGPAALAVSADGRTLAVLNRLSKEVTLLGLPNLDSAATVSCGGGPADIAALPGGGFAVVNSFADSVTLIDDAGNTVSTLSDIPKVPNGGAASESFLAVTTRVPPALRIYGAGSKTAAVTVPLDAAPVAVAVLDGERFVVGTESGVIIVEGRGGTIRRRFDVPVTALATDGNVVFALAEDGVHLLSIDGAETVEPLTTGGQGIGVDGDIRVVISPREKLWHITGLPGGPVGQVPPSPTAIDTAVEDPAPVVAVAPSPAPEPEPITSEPVVVEAKPVQHAAETGQNRAAETASNAEKSQRTAEPVVQEAQVAPPRDTAEAADTDSKEAEQPPVTTVAAGSEAREAPSAEEIRPSQQSFTQKPLGMEEAPPRRGARRPAAFPSLGPREPSVTDAMRGSAAFTAPLAGFKEIDWSRPMDLDATTAKYEDASKRWILDEAHVQSPDVSLRANEITVDQTEQSVRAVGDVHIEQELSVLTADEVYYLFGSAEAIETAPDASERQGAIEASNVRVDEPARTLTADALKFDFATSTGEVENAKGHSGVLYFGARKLYILGPASLDGEDIWVTTCDHDPPHYRIRMKQASLRDGTPAAGTHARLQFGKLDTPAYWPKWAFKPDREGSPISVDFDSGRRANTGAFLNIGQQFQVTPEVEIGPRLYPTEKEGIGVGLDAAYDFSARNQGLLQQSEGSLHSLYTTKDRGYVEGYHLQTIAPDTELRLRVEQWGDKDFVKDFYYELYRDRTEPRTYLNVTHVKPSYIATGTVRKRTNGFTTETERLPEVTFHVLERQIADRLYFSFDTVNGYNERRPSETDAVRTVNVARLTYDMNIAEAFSVTPFLEGDAAWYSHSLGPEDDPMGRVGATAGVTVQSRLHRAFDGMAGFSGFKHVFLPSITYSYRPEVSGDIEDTPRFDALDSNFGRSRLESKLDNILFGRDAETGETWQVARLTLYQGTDFWNEDRKSHDYEVEMDVRPRPWWGMQTAMEHHETEDDFNLDEPFFFRRRFLEVFERRVGRPFDEELNFQYNAQFGDYDRLLSYIYYDDTAYQGRFNARIGFAYTKTLDDVFNREIIYGLGYEVSEKWGFSFEHRYDFERSDLSRQTYRIRRQLHCWETTLSLTDREEGFDLGVQFNLTQFPGTRVKF